MLQRGVKKIGKDKIIELEKRDEVEYDTIMSFYQIVLQKEREAFEEQKKKKRNDVEIWAHAKKMEEQKITEAYCAKNGQKDVEKIQKAIEDRHKKEAECKIKLKPAVGSFADYKEAQLVIRREQFAVAQDQFRDKVGDEVKEQLLETARRQLQVLKIKEENRKAAQRRFERDQILHK